MLYAQCWELHHTKNAVALYIRYITWCVCYGELYWISLLNRSYVIIHTPYTLIDKMGNRLIVAFHVAIALNHYDDFGLKWMHLLTYFTLKALRVCLFLLLFLQIIMETTLPNLVFLFVRMNDFVRNFIPHYTWYRSLKVSIKPAKFPFIEKTLTIFNIGSCSLVIEGYST